MSYIPLLVNILQFSFSLAYTGTKILLYTFLSKMFICFLSLFVSIQISDAYVKVLSIIVFFSLNFSYINVIKLKHIRIENVVNKPQIHTIIQYPASNYIQNGQKFQ